METTSPSSTCKNCQTTFVGKFCPNCSQKADTHRFSILHFGHEFLHALTHTDKGIIHLIKNLFTKPGIVAREYMEGKRKKYFNPITFLLITMAIQIYATKKTDFFDAFITKTENFVKEMTMKVPTQGNNSLEDLQKMKKQTPKILENSKLITFIFLPVMAFFTWIFFWKSGFNYAENLMFSFFVQGQANIYFLLICIVPFLVFPSLVVIILYFHTFIVWIYSMVAYKQFYQQRTWLTVIKGSVSLILYYVFNQQIITLLMDYV